MVLRLVDVAYQNKTAELKKGYLDVYHFQKRMVRANPAVLKGLAKRKMITQKMILSLMILIGLSLTY